MASAFGGQRSIQLSYGRMPGLDGRSPFIAEFGPEGNTLGRVRGATRPDAFVNVEARKQRPTQISVVQSLADNQNIGYKFLLQNSRCSCPRRRNEMGNPLRHFAHNLRRESIFFIWIRRKTH